MATETDRGLADRLADVLEAAKDPKLVTATPAFQASIAVVAGRGQLAWSELDAAVLAAEEDASENRLAALRFARAAADGVEIYGWLRRETDRRLLDAPPWAEPALPPTELQARQDFMATAFPLSPSDLGNMKRMAVRTRLGETLRRIKGSPHVPVDQTARLTHATEAMDAAHAAVRQEAADDAAIADRLFEARVEANVHIVALRDHIASILRSDKSPMSLDDLLQQARARRAPAKQTTEPIPAPAPAPPLPPEDEPLV